MTSKFQQRHYEAIAELVQRASDYCENEEQLKGVRLVIEELAYRFALDNYNFNGSRFRAACVPGANIRARTNYKVPA